ncbi:ketol-acid reductoisomerase, partial [Candidatus Bathyarchaeota archaeon]
IVKEIQTGVFAREWSLEQRLGYPVFRKLWERAMRHPINEAERRLRELVSIRLP